MTIAEIAAGGLLIKNWIKNIINDILLKIWEHQCNYGNVFLCKILFMYLIIN